MTRLERAVRIRDVILGISPDRWEWRTFGEVRAKEVSGDGWRASYVSEFSRSNRDPAPETYLQALLIQRADPSLPNVLDMWVEGRGKVLSLEWDQHRAKLISMRPGTWEQELFNVEKYVFGRTAKKGAAVPDLT